MGVGLSVPTPFLMVTGVTTAGVSLCNGALKITHSPGERDEERALD